MEKFFDLSIPQKSLERILSEIEAIISAECFIMGPQVAELEKRLCAYTGACHCVTCASGTDALVLALLSANVKPGDRVFTTPFTFAATAEAIAFIGAIPIFVDIDIDTFNMSPIALELMLERHKEKLPKAIVAVDLFGLPADWQTINKLAEKYGLITTISDSAQSFGASVNGESVGTLADITCTSFFPTKPLGCFGDGGAIFTDFNIIADRTRALRVHGSTGKKYHHEYIGMNSRLDTIQAAILLEKLKLIDHQRYARRRLSNHFSDLLSNYGLSPQKIEDGYKSAYAIFSFRTPWRLRLQTEFEKAGIQTAIYYPIPLHEQEAYKQFAPYAPESLGNAEAVSRSILSLPIGGAGGHLKTLETTEKIKTILEKFMRKEE